MHMIPFLNSCIHITKPQQTNEIYTMNRYIICKNVEMKTNTYVMLNSIIYKNSFSFSFSNLAYILQNHSKQMKYVQ